MTTPPVTSVTDEMISEFERDVQRVWPDGDSSIITLSALLAERAELKRDALRIDWLASASNQIGNVQLPKEIVMGNIHSLRDAIDAAMLVSQ